jgi:hypothetical protein
MFQNHTLAGIRNEGVFRAAIVAEERPSCSGSENAEIMWEYGVAPVPWEYDHSLTLTVEYVWDFKLNGSPRHSLDWQAKTYDPVRGHVVTWDSGVYSTSSAYRRSLRSTHRNDTALTLQSVAATLVDEYHNIEQNAHWRSLALPQEDLGLLSYQGTNSTVVIRLAGLGGSSNVVANNFLKFKEVSGSAASCAGLTFQVRGGEPEPRVSDDGKALYLPEIPGLHLDLVLDEEGRIVKQNSSAHIAWAI